MRCRSPSRATSRPQSRRPTAPRISTRSRSIPTTIGPLSRMRRGTRPPPGARSSGRSRLQPASPEAWQRLGEYYLNDLSQPAEAGAGAARRDLPRPVLAAEPQRLRGRAPRAAGRSAARRRGRAAAGPRQERAPESGTPPRAPTSSSLEAELREERRKRAARVEPDRRVERVVTALECGERPQRAGDAAVVGNDGGEPRRPATAPAAPRTSGAACRRRARARGRTGRHRTCRPRTEGRRRRRAR